MASDRLRVVGKVAAALFVRIARTGVLLGQRDHVVDAARCQRGGRELARQLATSSTFDIDVVPSVNGGASFSGVPNPVTGAIVPYNAAATATCTSLNAGTPTTALNGGIRYSPFPQLAVGPDGCIHLTYSIGPNTSHTGDTVDVYYRRSCANGTSWEAAVKINDDGTATDQFLPNLSVSAANVVSVAFYDRRNDPTNNSAYDLYMRESVDGGTTFKPSVRVTTSPSPTFVESGLACSFADYDQQMQVPGAIYLLWTDARATFNGNPDTNVGFQKMDPVNGVCGSAVASPCNVTVNTLDTIANNMGDGIFALGVTASVFTSNTIRGNTAQGAVLSASTGDFVNGNTITGNGDGLVNLVNCLLGTGNLGNNIPLLCL